jgi:hypothetical protein
VLAEAQPTGWICGESVSDYTFGTMAQAATQPPQPETSDYFGDAHKVWMLNFRVRDLEKMAAQQPASLIHALA